MALNIKDESVHETVRRITQITGESQAQAVSTAVNERLARLQQDELATRLLAIGHKTAGRMSPECKDLDHGDLLYDERGLPAGLDPHFFIDLDAGLDAALRCGVRLDLVLLDFHWMFRGITHRLADPATGVLYEVQLPEGRADVLLSAPGREALLEAICRPLVRRYGPAGARADLGAAIFAYEFMNEPDFVVEEWERDLSPRVPRPLPFELLADLVSRLSAIVHTDHPGVLTTIGCARPHNLWAWDDDALGLDVLQVHSYPSGSVLDVPADALGMRRRVIIGEYPAESAEEYLQFALSSGYAGAWPWSFSGTDTQGRIPAEPLRLFAERHPALVNPRLFDRRD